MPWVTGEPLLHLLLIFRSNATVAVPSLVVRVVDAAQVEAERRSLEANIEIVQQGQELPV
jgi:hypothetical protein